ncbi:bifunctional tRNA (5-methylaminomethyl-2-thiouridine)(34)-methyltransferase MnmD/FAD-dependent 5-carboxymethylaminomethyl-2-thiouridine(34) oxidoreductase MnmC [Alteromonas sp. 5E99-2]|uniref:bifunctional tRNA (5-methylaminomethyl-2-thiouridine)(34)-methyltransferase MnmD/FAD-dependent 5-carboxymethylaminomethyl-2-thiouridine(34) oxidoreductase MnmC n=1 Tax=Alteromonas sp. 5E99-2 TaxID=2817683 RepID=UPI001A97EBFB|nr:bifunctional tRNA (5-methylaminomethyl-2-thiouridine)(34)-methyltransferase MnmD/FAD-dependent 5-carboxymethylaminomethyl-2-thiouridine(34) oxidoreductase MnmC [Alteromonas sp. 5E99-2]MBO1255110.1 bifunctional tRNA (5-methylaminomethyl-2-thiouridine)(34)-methyltransferase MnmD/FAD-dependent 5-carboxymethylaminomethyl-2-thiouridine(34) oxidoreductase MnmC [Alteromonas sp. 5E99-2]
MKINTAKIQFNEQNTPVAEEFDDVYFSNDDGAAETHYVFIQGNDLINRFKHCDKPLFIIAETGFGTGLNCAIAVEIFNKFRLDNPNHVLKRLQIISVEKYPLSAPDLSIALTKQPSSQAFKSALLSQYPNLIGGAHRLTFGAVSIDLWLGDAIEMFDAMMSSTQDKVDAWFLDGFAPSKNPDMWSQALFERMAALSCNKATLATFTAAGFVRRGLIEAGFTMRKAPGYGRKRDMLVGEYTPKLPPRSVNNHNNIAIIGGGLAGANAALALAKRGCNITLFDKNDIASGASGNPQGGFYPQLHAQVSNPSTIQALSFDYAKRSYQSLLNSRFTFEHDFCGVLQLAFSDNVKERHQKMKTNKPWPDTLIHPVTQQEASTIAAVPLEIGGMFLPQGGWISPPSLVKALLNAASAICKLTIVTNTNINVLEEKNGKVRVNAKNINYEFDHLVMASGSHTDAFSHYAHLPFGKTRGQVESIPTNDDIAQLQTVLCHKGYFAPKMNNRHALGSTYKRDDITTEYQIDDTHINLRTHKKALPNTAFIDSLQNEFTGRAATRMTLPDHQPVVGIVKDENDSGCFSVLSGLGSRGLTTAPLMAEILASELFAEPIPMAQNLYDAVHNTRFAKRAAKRG